MVRPKRLSLDWFTDCTTKEEQDSRRAQITNSSLTLQILRDILENHRTQLDKKKAVDYDTPSWQYRLAHDNGRKEEIDNLLKLLDPLTE